MLETIGLITYMACEDETNAKLRAQKTEKRIVLKVKEDDPQLINLICRIIVIIAHESPTEIILRDVMLLSDIHDFKCDENEPMEASQIYSSKYIYQK